ncbi:MAG: hypothetical protein ACFB03_23005 [Paracoccaceae bacterium]
MTRILQLDKFESQVGSMTLVDLSDDNPHANSLTDGDLAAPEETPPEVEMQDGTTPSEDDDAEAEIAKQTLSCLSKISASLDDLKIRALRDFEKLSTASLRSALPDLLDRNLAREISVTAARLIEKRLAPEAELTAGDDLYNALVDGLKAEEPAATIRVRRIEDQPVGTAHLSWDLGGADFLRTSYLSAAEDVLDRAHRNSLEGEKRDG